MKSKAIWGYSGDFLEACLDELNFDDSYIAAHPTWVMELHGEAVGFYSLEADSGETIELGSLFLSPGYVGRGWGRRLITHSFSQAKGMGFKIMIIQGDPNATGFYKRMGAIQIGQSSSNSIPGRVLPVFKIELESMADV